MRLQLEVLEDRVTPSTGPVAVSPDAAKAAVTQLLTAYEAALQQGLSNLQQLYAAYQSSLAQSAVNLLNGFAACNAALQGPLTMPSGGQYADVNSGFIDFGNGGDTGAGNNLFIDPNLGFVPPPPIDVSVPSPPIDVPTDC